MLTRYIGLILFVLLAIPFKFASASELSPSISIEGKSLNQMNLVVEYPISSLYTAVPVLYPGTIDGHATFISARSETNKAYEVTSKDGEYVIIAQPTDKKVYVTYRLKNQINSSDIGLYNFLLIYEKKYSDSIDVKTKSTHTNIVSPRMYNLYTSKPSDTYSLKVPDASESFRGTNISFIAISKGKNAPYEIKKYGQYVLVTPKNRTAQVLGSVRDIGFSNTMFKKIFDKTIDGPVLLVVTPFSRLGALSKESSGFTLNPHRLVFIDTSVISFQASLLYAKKILIHELTHILLESVPTIQGDTHLNWVNEGLAVYADIYASENYLYPKSSLADIKKIPINSRLLNDTEKQNIYSREFNFDVSSNTVDRPRTQTYSHLGTIFYNYFKLKNSAPEFLKYISACTDCSNIDVLNWMASKSGLSKQQLLYPN